MAESERARRLRHLLTRPELSYLLEAHDALSATIAEEAGVEGIWASSLTLSASRGLPDSGALSMTQALDVLESISERSGLPVLFDGDDGYGDLHQVQRLVRRLELRAVAGVCIEDKPMPKQNSFVRSEAQVLTDLGVQCAKLRAGKDAQRDPAFVIVARTEALITGLGVGAALERAERYVDAGADAVLVHSKAPTFAEVAEFMRQWSGRVPVVCVPTSYYATPLSTFRAAGVAMVIWANHLLRASIRGMQAAARKIAQHGTAREIEDDIAPLAEVFRLQDLDEVARRERVYASSAPKVAAVVLAATRGAGLDVLTEDRPKAMIPVGGEPVVERLLRQLRSEGVREIGVVRGYRPEAFTAEGVRYFDNRRFMETGEAGSLACARAMLEDDVIVAYGDLVLRQHLLHELMGADAPISILVEGGARAQAKRSGAAASDLIEASSPEPRLGDERPRFLRAIGADLAPERAHGRFMGLLRVRRAGMPAFLRALDALLATPRGEQAELSAILSALARDDPQAVRVLYVQGDWTDVNSLLDIARGHA